LEVLDHVARRVVLDHVLRHRDLLPRRQVLRNHTEGSLSTLIPLIAALELHVDGLQGVCFDKQRRISLEVSDPIRNLPSIRFTSRQLKGVATLLAVIGLEDLREVELVLQELTFCRREVRQVPCQPRRVYLGVVDEELDAVELLTTISGLDPVGLRRRSRSVMIVMPPCIPLILAVVGAHVLNEAASTSVVGGAIKQFIVNIVASVQVHVVITFCEGHVILVRCRWSSQVPLLVNI